jgi:hypothetical protein
MASNEKASKEPPNWKKFEQVIAEIQRALARDAKVRHDHRIKGKSGRKRKIDVSITTNVGKIPILIAIDCKSHKRLVEGKDVAAFYDQVDDVGAKGIMIATSGFDSGAIIAAAKYNILLKTYKEAEVTDWEQIVGKKSPISVQRIVYGLSTVSVVLVTKERLDVNPSCCVFLESGEFYGDENPYTFYHFFKDVWDRSKRPRLIGPVTLEAVDAKPPLFIKFTNEELIKVDTAVLAAEVRPKRYSGNIGMEFGKALKSVDNSNAVEILDAITQRVNVDEIPSEDWIDMTLEEWEQAETQSLAELPVKMALIG